MTTTHGRGLIAGWALTLVVPWIALSGCKGSAQPAAPPPPEVSVIEVRPSPVTVFNEYVAQTQAPDTIEIRSQVTGLLERQVFDTRPPRVEYRLTEAGRRLCYVVEALNAWAVSA